MDGGVAIAKVPEMEVDDKKIRKNKREHIIMMIFRKHGISHQYY